jgi:hypothetical protein
LISLRIAEIAGAFIAACQFSGSCTASFMYIHLCGRTFDSGKRDWTLANRGLDFEDAELVFDGLTAEVEDKRRTTESSESSASECSGAAWWSSATPRVAQCATFSA